MKISSITTIVILLITINAQAQITPTGSSSMTVCQAAEGETFDYYQVGSMSVEIYFNGILQTIQPSIPLVPEEYVPCCGIGTYMLVTSNDTAIFTVVPTTTINVVPGNCLFGGDNIVATNNTVNPGPQWSHFNYQWIKDGQIVSSGFAQLQGSSLTSPASGNYTLIVSQLGGCSDTSNTISYTNPCLVTAPMAPFLSKFSAGPGGNITEGENSTSTFTKDQEKSILVYPNPSEGLITIKGSGTFILINQLGQLRQQVIVDGEATIEINSPGVYFLKDLSSEYTKIIVN